MDAKMIPIFAMCIPMLGILYAMLNRYLQVREKQIEATGLLTAEKTAQYAAHTERLEQRVRVLERVITDRGIAISEEIEALRDQRDH